MQYLVISHGPMAKGTVESVEMILGKQSNLHNLAVTMDSTIDSMYLEIKQVVEKYQEEQWIILTDIIGGTPFNASYLFLSKNDNAIITAGFNLPLLIELLMNTTLKLEEAVTVIETILPNTMSIVDKVEFKTDVQKVYDL